LRVEKRKIAIETNPMPSMRDYRVDRPSKWPAPENLCGDVNLDDADRCGVFSVREFAPRTRRSGRTSHARRLFEREVENELKAQQKASGQDRAIREKPAQKLRREVENLIEAMAAVVSRRVAHWRSA
jgi:CTP-dependent riboflavin kinase